MAEDIVATAMAESLRQIAETVERRRACPDNDLADEYAMGREAGERSERQRIAQQLRGALASSSGAAALHMLLRDLDG